MVLVLIFGKQSFDWKSVSVLEGRAKGVLFHYFVFLNHL